jgi:hypothetical protein
MAEDVATIMTAEDTKPLLDKLAIAELPALYMRALDRLDRALIVEQFWDDAFLDYGVYSGNIEGFADYCMDNLRTHLHNHHFIGQSLIEVVGTTAYGETYFQAYHRITDAQGNDRDMFIAGRYVDRYEQRGGIWKFSYRCEIVDWARLDPASDSVLFGPASLWIRGKRKPDDQLYRRDAMTWPEPE